MNSSPALPPSLINLHILSNLTKLIIVANLRTIDEGYVEDVDEDMEKESKEGMAEEDEDMAEENEDMERPFSYSSPLPWLAARLEKLTPASNLSEIILRFNLSVTDTILKNINWTDLSRILSSLSSLNLVTLKVSGQYTPLSPAQWAVLRSNQDLSPLVDDGRLVLVNTPPKYISV